MEIRKARKEELTTILTLYENARRFMAENGNPSQWKSGYPSEEIVKGDMERGELYVLEEKGELQAVFVFFLREERNYREILKGRWLNERPYGTVHRITSASKQKGAASCCLAWCFGQCFNLRIDTHRDNLPMRRMLEKNGFQECGIIKVEDGTERIAYQKTKGQEEKV